MIGHGANKMKKNGKNTKVNTQHSQNKLYITCKAGRYSTREKHPIFLDQALSTLSFQAIPMAGKDAQSSANLNFLLERFTKNWQRNSKDLLQFNKKFMHPHMNRRQALMFLLRACK